VYYGTNLIFIVFSVACAVSSNLNMLITFRFFNGLGVVCTVLNFAVVGDMYAKEERGGFLSILWLSLLVGLSMGPLIEGYVGEYAGWRWVF